MITLSVNTADLTRLANMIGAAGERAPAAIARGINRPLRDIRTALAREVRDLTGFPYRSVLRRVKMQNATPGHLRGTISLGSRPIPLKYLQPKQEAGGVRFNNLGERDLREGAFDAPGMKVTKGNKGKRRKSLGGHIFARAGAGRYPLVLQTGPTLGEALIAEPSQAEFYRQFQAKVVPEIERQLFAVVSGQSWAAGGGRWSQFRTPRTRSDGRAW